MVVERVLEIFEVLGLDSRLAVYHILFQYANSARNWHTIGFFSKFFLANVKCKEWSSACFPLFPVSGQENNFEITSSAFVTTQGVPYDLGSVMHYSAYAFSRNGQPTIVPVNPNVQLSSLGQRNGFSQSDIQHVNTLYCGGGKHCYSPRCKQKYSLIYLQH